jgi:hypothetical protein
MNMNVNLYMAVCERVIRAVKREATREQREKSSQQEILSFDSAAGTSRLELKNVEDSAVSYRSQFMKYCDLANLPVEEQKFCYDTDSIRQDLYKMLDFGADASRICKKVLKANPDFCRVPTASKLTLNEAPKSIMANNRDSIRGVIYE